MSWAKIEEVTLSASQATVTLGNGGTIPQTYKTLKVVISARNNNSAVNGDLLLQFNGNATSYADRYLLGYGSDAGSGISPYGTTRIYVGAGMAGANATASTFGNTEVTIPNYSGSTNKPVSADGVSENNGTNSYQVFSAGIWNSTAAITSIQISNPGSSSFVSGCTFTLYGLA